MAANGVATVFEDYVVSDTQLWTLKSVGNSFYQIINKSNGKAVTVSGDNPLSGSIIDLYTPKTTTSTSYNQNCAFFKRVNMNQTGIETPRVDRKIEVYPNPNNGDFKIKLPENTKLNSVMVYSINGVKMYEIFERLNSDFELKLKNTLSSRLYILQISTPNGLNQEKFEVKK